MSVIKAVAACAVVVGSAAAVSALAPGWDAPAAAAQTKMVRRAQEPWIVPPGHGRLGVSLREVDEQDAKTARLSPPAGAVVEEVASGSAAETAGLRNGDVIVEFDGERVRSARQLTRLVQETADGRQVNAVVVRDGQKTTVNVALREGGASVFEKLHELEEWGRSFAYELPARPARPARPSPRADVRPPDFRGDNLFGGGGGRLGITVDDLSPQLAEYFGTKDGVLVTSVQDDSLGARVGLKAGDVITALDGSTIGNPAELRRRLQAMTDGQEFTIAVMRDRKAQSLKGKFEGQSRRRTYRSIV
jgi:serine protease Do